MCNVALKRPSYQSSVYANAAYGPHRANDGMWTDGGRFVHSNRDTNPWWTVDLGVPLSIMEIFFTNREYSDGEHYNFL